MADSQRKTANLFDYSAITTGYRIQWTSGNPYADVTAIMSDYIPVTEGDYALSTSLNIIGYAADKSYIGVYRLEKTWEKRASDLFSSFTVLSNTNVKFVRLLTFGANDPITDALMLNTGSTPLPYEPYGWVHSLRKLGTVTDTLTTLPSDIYADGNNATVGLVGNMSQTGTPTPQNPIQPQECGDLETEGAKAGQYKIPISSANTTTPVYLGKVQSTRKIKKLVLTGGNTENWEMVPSSNAPFVLRLDDILETASANTLNWLSNQYVAVTSAATWSNYDYCITSLVHGQHLRFRDIRYNSLGNFLTYLQQQYAAGTPVTVWYVQSTPTTGIVNEPLRKIGDYADTVSGITIPTIAGADSFDVLTTLKPSEVSLTYTGWHDASAKEWDGSEWQ